MLRVGSEGLGESRLYVDQLGADVGGAELGGHAGSLALSLGCLRRLRLGPVTGDGVGGDQHGPLSQEAIAHQLSSLCWL